MKYASILFKTLGRTTNLLFRVLSYVHTRVRHFVAPYNEFDSYMIFTIKNTIVVWSDEFQDIVFRKTKVSNFSNIMVKTVPLDNGLEKKRTFGKIMFCLE